MTRPTIAVLIACHDRRAKTVACITALQAQDVDAELRLVVFDDGSQDGTATAVRRLAPAADILRGDGTAFWAGGMRAAFDHALRRDPDFLLWLNDDVVLAPDAVTRLLAVAGCQGKGCAALALVGGAVVDPGTGQVAYGGIDRASRVNPLRFARCPPLPETPRRCATLNGNVVLVPRALVWRIGSIGDAFIHTLGDLDYGLRAGRAGAWVGLAPGAVGTCAANTRVARWFNPALPLRDRWRLLRHPLGFPLRPWLHFARAHGGPLWFIFALLPFWRLVIPPGVAARLRPGARPVMAARERRHAG